MTLALTAPARIKQLVVADIAPVHYEAHHDGVFAGLAAIDLAQLTSRQQAEGMASSRMPETPVRQFLPRTWSNQATGLSVAPESPLNRAPLPQILQGNTPTTRLPGQSCSSRADSPTI